MSYRPDTNRALRAGSVALTVLDLTKAVTFPVAMPTTSYRIMLQVEGNLAATLWPSAKTTTGFTLNVSAGIVGSVSYLAVEDG